MLKRTTHYWTRNRFLAWMLVIGLAVAAAIFVRTHRKIVTDAVPTLVKIEDIQRGMKPARWDGTYPCVLASVSNLKKHDALGRCATSTARTGAVDSFEVDLRYGDFILRQTDLRLNDVFDVPLTRSYDSGEWFTLNHLHAFGLNSNHPFDIAPLGTHNPYTEMELALEDGDLLYFKRISDGTGYWDAVFMHTDTSTRFYKATIAWNGNGWTLKLTDGTEMIFPESYNSKNLAQGAATEILDAAGHKLKLLRDPERNLQQIVTPHGHRIRFTYDRQARIVQAKDDAGNTAQYTYNHDGMLVSVVSSSGEERHYEYKDKLMTAVKDEDGNTLVRNAYASGSVERQEFANGDVYTFSYQWSPNKKYATAVRVTLPDHSFRDVHIDEAVPQYQIEK